MPKKRDRDAALSRRALVRWSLATGAALGLRPWQVFEALESSGQYALADDASCQATNRSVHAVAGAGGLGWFQLFWPHVDIAQAENPNHAFHAPGEAYGIEGTDQPLMVSPEAPFQWLRPGRQLTALMGGRNEQHTNQPASTYTIDSLSSTSVFAACAALQKTNASLVPAIAIDDCPYGSAPGAPSVTRVPSVEGLVGLFNSVASRDGQTLARTSDAEIFNAHYKAFLTLNAAAGRPTTRRGYTAGQKAAGLLGINLAGALSVSADDFARYGITTETPARVGELAKILIVVAKALSMGLTSQVILPAMRTDPHDGFTNVPLLRTTLDALGRCLDAFWTELEDTDDPACAGASIADNTIMSFHGDTPRDPFTRPNWPDSTPLSSNWIYVLGGGYLRSGWFGGIDRRGVVSGYDPATGTSNGARSNTLGEPSAATIAYAVAKGDMQRVQEFYRGPELSGVVHESQQ